MKKKYNKEHTYASFRNKPQAKKTIKDTRGIGKYLDLNDNEDRIYQNLWTVTKTVLREEFYGLKRI